KSIREQPTRLQSHCTPRNRPGLRCCESDLPAPTASPSGGCPGSVLPRLPRHPSRARRDSIIADGPEPQEGQAAWKPERLSRKLRPEEIEVAALVSLEDVLEVEPAVAAAVSGRGRPPLSAAAGQLGVGDVQLEAAAGDVQLDLVAIAHERERAADGGFGGNVEDNRA